MHCPCAESLAQVRYCRGAERGCFFRNTSCFPHSCTSGAGECSAQHTAQPLQIMHAQHRPLTCKRIKGSSMEVRSAEQAQPIGGVEDNAHNMLVSGAVLCALHNASLHMLHKRRTQGGIKEVWSAEQAQRVASRSGVEDDAREVRVLGAAYEAHHVGDGHQLVHPRRQRFQQLTCTHKLNDTTSSLAAKTCQLLLLRAPRAGLRLLVRGRHQLVHPRRQRFQQLACTLYCCSAQFSPLAIECAFDCYHALAGGCCTSGQQARMSKFVRAGHQLIHSRRQRFQELACISVTLVVRAVQLC